MEVLDKNHKEIKDVLENLDSISIQLDELKSSYIPLFEGEHYLTNKQVANILQVSERTLQEYRNKGLISFIDTGIILYKESDVRIMLDNAYVEAWGNSIVR